MSENVNQPTEYDAVLGGYVEPINGLVLGGLAGVNNRLSGADLEEKVAAIKDAIQYGEEGLELVIKSLKDPLEKVNQAAYILLCNRPEAKVKQAIRKYNPWQFLKCLGKLYGYSEQVLTIPMSPDGQNIFVGGYGAIHIWDWQTKTVESRKLQNYLKYINLFAFSPDKQQVIVANNQLFQLWDWQTGCVKSYAQVATSKNKREIIYLDEEIIIFREHYSQPITVQNWYTGETIGKIDDNRQIYKAAISLDRKTVVTYNKRINVWDLPSGTLKYSVDDKMNWFSCFSISSSCSTLVTGDAIIKVWDLHTGKMRKNIGKAKFHKKEYYAINYLTISPDGETIVAARSDGTLNIWNLHTGELQRSLQCYSQKIDCITFSPDGQMIVTSDKRTITVWGIPFQL